MQEFYCKTRIISGENALQWLDGQRCKSLLMVADPYFMENGWAERLAGRVKAEKRNFFSRVQPDPSVEQAAEGTALMRSCCPDLLIALGGGSAMDTAKAMRYFAGGEETFVAIPTTSGSGSEVTDFSVLTHEGTKHPLIHKRMQPDVAILSEELVRKLPPKLVAEGGFDVISHALESFVATGATALTKALAAGAFCTVMEALPASYRGDTRVRGKIHLASTMAGIAFSGSGLGMCHALSHSLGGIFHLPHGRLNAILLPAVVACNEAAAEYAKLARLAGMGGGADMVAARNLRNGLIRLRAALDLPATLYQAGIQPQALRQQKDRILTAALADPCMATNPVPGTYPLLEKVLEAVSGGA